MAEETPWLRDDSLMMTSNIMESTTRDDEIEDQGSQPSGKRKRPMAGGVVFSDDQRVSDVRPEEPPPPRCPKRERYIQSLLRFKGVETRPLWADALPVFYDITTNVSRKQVESMLRDAGHFLEANDVTTIYNKVKVETVPWRNELWVQVFSRLSKILIFSHAAFQPFPFEYLRVSLDFFFEFSARFNAEFSAP